MQEEACSVCWRNFSTALIPTVLICGHSFCGECAGLVRACPLCRQRVPTNMPRRTNYSLLSLLEKMERYRATERTHRETQTEDQTAHSSSMRVLDQPASFFDGKLMTLNMRKTGIRFAIK